MLKLAFTIVISLVLVGAGRQPSGEGGESGELVGRIRVSCMVEGYPYIFSELEWLQVSAVVDNRSGGEIVLRHSPEGPVGVRVTDESRMAIEGEASVLFSRIRGGYDMAVVIDSFESEVVVSDGERLELLIGWRPRSVQLESGDRRLLCSLTESALVSPENIGGSVEIQASEFAFSVRTSTSNRDRVMLMGAAAAREERLENVSSAGELFRSAAVLAARHRQDDLAASFNFRLGRIEMASGNFEAAEVALEAALQRTELSSLVAPLLANVYRELGREEEAVAILEQMGSRAK